MLSIGKVLTCPSAETWDNIVWRNGNSVDRDTANGVTAKCSCCPLRLLAPKWALRPAEVCSISERTAHPQLECLCLFSIVLFWHPSKFIPISYFLAHLMCLSLAHFDALVLYLPLIWPGTHPPRCLFFLSQRFHTNKIDRIHSFYYQAHYHIGLPHFEGEKDGVTVSQNSCRFDFQPGCHNNSVRKEQSFQQMVLRQFHMYMQMNEVGTLSSLLTQKLIQNGSGT